MDNKKHELTEQLKVIENEIHEHKIDLRSITSKLQLQYDYEEELNLRMESAKKKTSELRKDFFEKSHEISTRYERMKKIFDVWTANFYIKVESHTKK